MDPELRMLAAVLALVLLVWDVLALPTATPQREEDRHGRHRR